MKNIKKIGISLISTVFITTLIIGIDLSTNKEDNIATSINKYNSFNELSITNDVADVITNNDNSKEVINDNKKDTTVVSKEETVSKVDKENVIKEELIPKVEEKVETTSNNTSNSLETIVGNISGYGHDCYGCTSGRTASGIDISDGHIFYDDTEYGKIRMVAGDKKYPFGTIVKISNFMGLESFYAIIEDRGGAIGLNKNIQFDLLFPQNSDALNIGIQKNVTFEIMRLGY